MDFGKLFILLDSLIGDIAVFRGLTYGFDHGDLTIDLFEEFVGDDTMFICDFIPHDGSEPVYFGAKGVDELKEQISHYALV